MSSVGNDNLAMQGEMVIILLYDVKIFWYLAPVLLTLQEGGCERLFYF